MYRQYIFKSLDSEHLISAIHHVCQSFLAYTFLQDDHFPVFAFLPKIFNDLPSKISYIRQDDFQYCSQNQENFIPQFQQTERHATEFSGFTGGYISFISYDYAASQFITLQHHSDKHAYIGEFDIFIKKIQQNWILHFPESFDLSPAKQTFIQKLIHDIEQYKIQAKQSCFALAHPMQARWQKVNYQHAFQRVIDYLHAGDCYQINLTHEFHTQIKTGQLKQLFIDFIQQQHAPYSAYFGFDDFELLSMSPELFIEFHADKTMITRPIKGTLARDSDPNIDDAQKEKLANSEKDQAENLMIVDLLRNDLSLYAENNSVKVPKLFEIESFQHVHHMVSEITATLRPETHPWQMLLSALPGGSITGAPKIRAMQIIDELEQNSRGAYCGAIGYFNYDGSGRFNILIRTLQRQKNRLSAWAGGGITVASELEAEYQESLDKVNALLEFINTYHKTE